MVEVPPLHKKTWIVLLEAWGVKGRIGVSENPKIDLRIGDRESERGRVTEFECVGERLAPI